MRARNLGVAVLILALVALGLKFFLRKDKSEVSLTLVCLGGAIPSPIIDPDPAEITDRTKHFTWTLVGNSNVKQAKIIQKGSNPWPFKDVDVLVRPGNAGKSKDLKDNLPGGTYKYSIEALCPFAGGSEQTVTIDPDMIIPKGTVR